MEVHFLLQNAELGKDNFFFFKQTFLYLQYLYLLWDLS